MTATMSETETVWCETCGEAPATVRLAEASLCEDCAGAFFTEILGPHMWAKPCGRPLFDEAGGLTAICAQPYGSEHDHAAMGNAK